MKASKRILLVELCANGDCLYATAIAKQIKEDYPGCHLTWAIAGFCKDIISGNPHVDDIMEVNDAPKNDLAAFRRFKKRVFRQKATGKWDEVFITQVIDDNTAYYDGCIRSATLRGYGKEISVPVTPILRISEEEKQHVRAFVERNKLSKYKHVILFEFSPLSGQAKITKQDAIAVAEHLVNNNDVAVILSSGDKVHHPDSRIVDGSILSIRETAELTHYCNFLIGCSSGITWVSTSDAARTLPMVQLLVPDSIYLNSVARDFKRQGLDDSGVIELTNHEIKNIVDCISMALINFETAKNIYHTDIPVSFVTSRYIVCNLLIHFQFKAIARHIKVNTSVYGHTFSFYKECIKGALIVPFIVIKIIWQRTR